MYTLHDDFLVNNVLCKIASIHELEEGSYAIIVGTIKMFEDDQQWYYRACKACRSKVDKNEDTGVEQCLKFSCLDKELIVVPSFKLKIRVQGVVGVVTLTLFDREARSLLNISVPELLQKYEKVGNNDFPIELNDLLDQKLAFKIQVKSFTAGKYVRSYNISKVTDDVDIINALEKVEKKMMGEQDINSESAYVTLSDVNSQETVNLKDAISFTADNTPNSNVPELISKSLGNKTDIDDFISPSNTTKRKLVDVYDLEDDVCESATKPLASSIEGSKTGGSIALLIPKVEK